MWNFIEKYGVWTRNGMKRTQTVGPILWTKIPLMTNPTSPPVDSLRAHKLCISAAKEGWLMLFCATQASITTSPITTPAVPAVNSTRARTRCTSQNDNTSMENTPRIPITIKKSNHTITSEILLDALRDKFRSNLKVTNLDTNQQTKRKFLLFILIHGII